MNGILRPAFGDVTADAHPPPIVPFNDEPTFNTALARALRGRNPRWREDGGMGSEQLRTFRERGRPDVLIPDERAPVVVESEFAPARNVEADARARLGRRLRDSDRTVANAIALRAPARLREVPQADLDRAVEECAEYDFALFHAVHSGNEPSRWPGSGWLRGDLDALADLIESCAVSESLVSETLDVFEATVHATAADLRRMAKGRDTNERIASLLHQEDGIQTSRMAMAILANAFTYHAMLAGSHGIRPAQSARLPNGNFVPSQVLAEWRRILSDVNYWPIFHIAGEIAAEIPVAIAAEILARLAALAERLVSSGAARSQDLSGRLFQRLIADRKFLATFYTLPVSATLLAELAVQMMDVDWSDRDGVAELRVADFACGTGTLLSAAYQAMLRRRRRAGGDDRDLHADMMERALFGADIMPAATHLTASMLSSANPATIFHDTRIYTLPYGEDKDVGRGARVYIGSLDLIDDQHGVKLFPTGIRRTTGHEGVREASGEEMASDFALSHDSMDLVIMNPPFTRATNHESVAVAKIPVPSFAGFSTTEDEQKRMAGLLARKRKHLEFPVGHGNAGLASDFVDLAHVKLRPGGVLAMVLPLSMVRGASWSKVRQLLAERYKDVVLITIAQAKRHDKSFSADTGMGEVLVVARKRNDVSSEASAGRRKSAEAGRRMEKPVHWVSIHSRPRVEAEAQSIALRIGRSTVRRGPTVFRIGDLEVGWTLSAPIAHGGYASLADVDVATAAVGLEAGRLQLPGPRGMTLSAPVTELEAVAARGLLHRDINGTQPDGSPRGPFDIEARRPGEVTGWPVLWKHDSGTQRRLVVSPAQKGVVRPGMKQRADEVWSTATHLHFNLNFQVNAQSLSACWTDKKTIGGPSWPNLIARNPRHEKTLLLWLNTTLGLLLSWWRGARQQTAKSQLTITRLPAVPVLDTRELGSDRHDVAAEIFERFRTREFLPANEAWRDDARKDLDRAVLCDLLELSQTVLEPLDLLRNKWCAEPSVHGGKPTRIPA